MSSDAATSLIGSFANAALPRPSSTPRRDAMPTPGHDMIDLDEHRVFCPTRSRRDSPSYGSMSSPLSTLQSCVPGLNTGSSRSRPRMSLRVSQPLRSTSIHGLTERAAVIAGDGVTRDDLERGQLSEGGCGIRRRRSVAARGRRRHRRPHRPSDGPARTRCVADRAGVHRAQPRRSAAAASATADPPRRRGRTITRAPAQSRNSARSRFVVKTSPTAIMTT